MCRLARTPACGSLGSKARRRGRYRKPCGATLNGSMNTEPRFWHRCSTPLPDHASAILLAHEPGHFRHPIGPADCSPAVRSHPWRSDPYSGMVAFGSRRATACAMLTATSHRSMAAISLCRAASGPISLGPSIAPWQPARDRPPRSWIGNGRCRGCLREQAHAAVPAIRSYSHPCSSTRLTCTADHVPPRAVEMPRWFSPAAICRRDDAPKVTCPRGSAGHQPRTRTFPPLSQGQTLVCM